MPLGQECIVEVRNFKLVLASYIYRLAKECSWGKHMGTQGVEKCVSTFLVLPATLSYPSMHSPSYWSPRGGVTDYKSPKVLQLENGENLPVLLHILLKLLLWIDFALRDLLPSILLFYWSHLIGK